jgi:putative Mn2+ efflux pump MntP
MSILEIALIAIGLAMDAFAVSVTSGLAIHRLQLASGHHSFRRELAQAALVAACFGFFQALMPFLGWLLGMAAQRWIAPVDHWVAWILLSLIGGHMLWEARHPPDDDADAPLVDPVRPLRLLVLGIATSIDALAAGISLAAVGVGIWQPVIVIGGVTAAFSYLGTLLGNAVGSLCERQAAVLGGLILLGLGLKILWEGLRG